MSAENAWRIARERCASIAQNACLVPPDGGSPSEEERVMCDLAAEYIIALPMPPAFRAEVEAEARAFAQREHPYADLHVEALAEIKATIDGNSDQPVAAIIEGLLEEIRARSDRLSRLEAKGESHE